MSLILTIERNYGMTRANNIHSGGIRGIVELEVLRHIEMALGGMPIQCFIDLIVGTRFAFRCPTYNLSY